MTISKPLTGPIVLVRGAGEQASGVGWALAKAGFRVVMTETEHPLMVRWPVSFGTAVEEGEWTVEGRVARLLSASEAYHTVWEKGEIPILIDPELDQLYQLKPDVLVDAILAKRNLGTKRSMAPLTIGLGPGFSAGEDVHIVIETNRGHNLGRIITSGSAEPNTGVPGNVAGYSQERVIYSPRAGIFRAEQKIGQRVLSGDRLGTIYVSEDAVGIPIFSPVDGVLRGLLRTGVHVEQKVKLGDIDPRGNVEYCWTISDKARAIGAAVVLSILEQISVIQSNTKVAEIGYKRARAQDCEGYRELITP